MQFDDDAKLDPSQVEDVRASGPRAGGGGGGRGLMPGGCVLPVGGKGGGCLLLLVAVAALFLFQIVPTNFSGDERAEPPLHRRRGPRTTGLAERQPCLSLPDGRGRRPVGGLPHRRHRQQHPGLLEAGLHRQGPHVVHPRQDRAVLQGRQHQPAGRPTPPSARSTARETRRCIST
ncbi:hypothetical protein [Nonomuraea dietziae]|uniref:hypothetical protein n=1 Tax=Nonomuraea dietziae TaxID=65515 RepID=UPI0031D4A644